MDQSWTPPLSPQSRSATVPHCTSKGIEAGWLVDSLDLDVQLAWMTYESPSNMKAPVEGAAAEPEPPSPLPLQDKGWSNNHVHCFAVGKQCLLCLRLTQHQRSC